VEVGDYQYRIVLVLQLDAILNAADQVSKVKPASRAVTREYSFL
jgi:hypothetical protein